MIFISLILVTIWIFGPSAFVTSSDTDRPAPQRLLQAVESRELDCVVVYKVDRLSRSLPDFTRMVSFVVVTQQFNTSTSLGRLTLSIHLRSSNELIGERTRHKMSAARRKGKWVGSCPVVGYDLDPAGGEPGRGRTRASLLSRCLRKSVRFCSRWRRSSGEDGGSKAGRARKIAPSLPLMLQ
jgi:hypothetical protein